MRNRDAGASLQGRPAAAAGDPLEEANRLVHAVNGQARRHRLAPLARAHATHVRGGGTRTGIAHVARNLGKPGSPVGGLAAGDLAAALNATSRFAFNPPLGLGGVHDRAAGDGFGPRPVSLADAACRWGVPSRPSLVRPLVGPSAARDAGALAPGTAALDAAIGP